MGKFSGKNILVVGAGSGVGRSIAIGFAAEGANLILVGRNQSNLVETKSLMEEENKARIIITDIRDEKAVETMMNQIVSDNLHIDISINCAGLVKVGALDEMSLNDFSSLLDTNLKGVWLLMKHQLIQMKKQKQGTIINISANIGLHSIRQGMGGYAASKAALTVLTKTAALEALDFNVRIHSVSPGPLDTQLSYRSGEDKAARDLRISQTNPSKRVGELEEVFKVVKWLCESPAYMVGQDIVIDGGASI